MTQLLHGVVLVLRELLSRSKEIGFSARETFINSRIHHETAHFSLARRVQEIRY